MVGHDKKQQGKDPGTKSKITTVGSQEPFTEMCGTQEPKEEGKGPRNPIRSNQGKVVSCNWARIVLKERMQDSKAVASELARKMPEDAMEQTR